MCKHAPLSPVLLARESNSNMQYKTESKIDVLFVAVPPSCYKNRATYDNTDLSNIDLGNSYYFPIVAKFCYLGCMFTRD